MYLKEIKAQGFKSFADKIRIELTDGITGIVGPNGSGKSNVVDAVRWVLGEQSVKSLRGTDNMTDVIFSGSKSRNALNVASVTLVFDNQDHYLPISFDEVSIKRRVYKDGSNEYYLNGEKCRLKDIVEILLDSGIAKESFNIISQGKIEEILSNRPQDRRVIFEEAAGVLKYKRRKEDALRKLDKTHDNMNRVEDIIRELGQQVEPLKEQREKAIHYNEVKAELEDLELGLVTNDITFIHQDYKDKKEKVQKLNEEILSISTSHSGNEANLEELKLKIENNTREYHLKQQKLVELTSKVEKLNSRKSILLERQKYEVEDSKLHENLLSLKENQFKLEHDKELTEQEIEHNKIELQKRYEQVKKQEEIIINTKNKRQKQERELNDCYHKLSALENKISYVRESLEHNGSLPNSVRSLLGNPKLVGIHDVIGNVVEMDEAHSTAIAIALGYASNYVIVDSEQVAKEAISYLKQHNLGRATFFPINIISPKYVDDGTLNIIRNESGFIGIASDLVQFDYKYRGIVLNQLGNVVVAQDMDSANTISKKMNYRYRVVTLDGELLHTGGSITGGVQSTRNQITLKFELEDLLRQMDVIQKDIRRIEEEMNEIDHQFKAMEDKLYLIRRDNMLLQDEITHKEKAKEELILKLDEMVLESNSITHMMNATLSKEEEEVMEAYYSALKEKDALSELMRQLDNIIEHDKGTLEEMEYSVKSENTLFHAKSKELKDLEIDVNRMDVKLDNLLNILNETYHITYEKAKDLYHLEVPVDVARNRVSVLKRELNEIGIVNLGAIAEYDRISERYEFLIGQKDDLIEAENTLLEIIQEMDSVMKKEFMDTFTIIQKNFTETFQELFHGGYAELKLTHPDDLLETGIDIIASPPGKKLTSISLLSGGEKTFTAISLLFAILKSRPMPFCILDEVEAALDEANVVSFGEYLKKLKDKTQFIVITHKKKTMEFVDCLYGITMQESGVSKLVSVKLEEVK